MIYHNSYKNKNLRQILETFSHYQQVNFAFYCSKEIEPFTNDQRVIDCNLAVERWLKGDQTVDLELARNNARNAWDTYSDATASTASTAVYAAVYSTAAAYYAAYYAAAASSSSANSASSNSAVYAADAKSSKLHPNNTEQRNVVRNQFLNEYKQIAQNWLSLWEIPNFPKDEPDFPIFDFLQDYNLISYLLPKNDNFYYLNLNGFNIKHVNETELLKLIDTIHIRNILRRIINNAETS